MSSAEPVLEADGVVVERGDRRVLDGVDLVVNPGERLLIQGESGAGKTTLFEVLGLLDRPDEGRLLVDGRDAADLPDRERSRLRRERVAVVFQEFQLVPDLTARENVALPQEHAGTRDPEWITELLAGLDVADIADQYPATLSGGEKQRVAAARALANRPDLVLADEPTGQLDPAAGTRLLDLFFDLQERTGTALVVVSHDRSLAERFPDVVQLRDGRLRRA